MIYLETALIFVALVYTISLVGQLVIAHGMFSGNAGKVEFKWEASIFGTALSWALVFLVHNLR